MPFETSTMTAQDVIDYTKIQFGDEADIQITTAHIIRWINTAQRSIVEKNTTINEVTGSTDVVKGKTAYPIPTTAGFQDILVVNAVLHNGLLLSEIGFNDAMARIKANPDAEGTPEVWWIKANVLNLFPAPDATVNKGIQLYFTKAPAKIINPGDKLGVPDNYYNAITQYVMKQAYEMDENFQAAGQKNAEFESEVNTQQNQTRQHGNSFPVIQYEEGDDW